jgi:hypothetical protein
MTSHNTPDGLSEAQKNYPNDQKRIRTRKAALLNLLQDGNWHPNYELMEVGGLSFNSYLYQLRRDGWKIRSRRLRRGVWEQQLVGRGDPPFQRRALSGPQQRVLDELTLAVQKVYGADGFARIVRELEPWLRNCVESGLPIT